MIDRYIDRQIGRQNIGSHGDGSLESPPYVICSWRPRKASDVIQNPEK
jgi:hypothetical protein